MSELVTDAMVEAAAAASYDAGVFIYDMHCPVWTKLTPLERDEWLVSARAALEAVAPLIAAAAWEEGYQACRNRPRVDGYLINRANPYQTRADAIERAEQ